jgi:hypothetical protein
MIYKRHECVVLDDGRVGRINDYYYAGSIRWYLVQFGAGGPFVRCTEQRLRPASKLEEDILDGVKSGEG